MKSERSVHSVPTKYKWRKRYLWKTLILISRILLQYDFYDNNNNNNNTNNNNNKCSKLSFHCHSFYLCWQMGKTEITIGGEGEKTGSPGMSLWLKIKWRGDFVAQSLEQLPLNSYTNLPMQPEVQFSCSYMQIPKLYRHTKNAERQKCTVAISGEWLMSL